MRTKLTLLSLVLSLFVLKSCITVVVPESKASKVIVLDDDIEEIHEEHSVVALSEEGDTIFVNSDENVIVEDNHWVTDNSKKKKNVRIIKSKANNGGKISSINVKQINNGKNDKENIFIVKTKNADPLYYIDGKKADKGILKNIDPDTIDSVSVLKGENAIEKYGEEAKNGVIEIYTK